MATSLAMQRFEPLNSATAWFEGWALKERYLETRRLLNLWQITSGDAHVSAVDADMYLPINDAWTQAPQLSSLEQLREAIEMFTVPSSSEIVALHPVISSILDDVLTGDIQCDIDLSPQCNIFADKAQAEQAIAALVRNAVEAEASWVSVRCRTSGNDVVLTVADNGIGIRRDTFDLLFTPFFSTKGAEHLGLGLCRVGVFVAAVGGQIRVDAQSAGTEMTLVLPQWSLGQAQTFSDIADHHFRGVYVE